MTDHDPPSRPLRVFVDVGAHMGSSAALALQPPFRFDRVISVEPDPQMVEVLRERFSAEREAGRYVVAPYGLGERCGEAELFGDNTGGGASLLAQKSPAAAGEGRRVSLLDWPSFSTRYQLDAAELFVKINAEGAEVPILKSMLASGARNVSRLVVDFDVIKVPFGAWQKWRTVRALRRNGIPFDLAEAVLLKRPGRHGLAGWFNSLPGVVETPVPAERASRLKRARMTYLECVSALGIRLDVFKARR
ncbi:MAG: FkbM family methyltransferase [Pseudomonadota bacterium]